MTISLTVLSSFPGQFLYGLAPRGESLSNANAGQIPKKNDSIGSLRSINKIQRCSAE